MSLNRISYWERSVLIYILAILGYFFSNGRLTVFALLLSIIGIGVAGRGFFIKESKFASIASVLSGIIISLFLLFVLVVGAACSGSVTC